MSFGAGVEGLDDDDLKEMGISITIRAIPIHPPHRRVHPHYKVQQGFEYLFSSISASCDYGNAAHFEDYSQAVSKSRNVTKVYTYTSSLLGILTL